MPTSPRPNIRLRHIFVESAPDVLDANTLYISIEYASVIHKCCCGCGREVVTPLSPTDWELMFDGVSISLRPSIGNWSLPCRSHYWISKSRVHWAEDWSDKRVARGRAAEAMEKARYYAELNGGTRSTGEDIKDGAESADGEPLDPDET